MLGHRYEGQDCSLARALEVVGERWSLLIIRDAFFGVRRFDDFVVHLDIPRAVLSERLRRLIDQGVLAKVADPARAGRHCYELTDAGKDLWPALYALLTWGGRHHGGQSRRYTHADCGTELDNHGSCPACGGWPALESIIISPRPGFARRRTDPVTLAMRQPHRLLEPLDTTTPLAASTT